MGPYYDDLDFLLWSLDGEGYLTSAGRRRRFAYRAPGLGLSRLSRRIFNSLRRALAMPFAWRKRSCYEVAKAAPQR